MIAGSPERLPARLGRASPLTAHPRKHIVRALQLNLPVGAEKELHSFCSEGQRPEFFTCGLKKRACGMPSLRRLGICAARGSAAPDRASEPCCKLLHFQQRLHHSPLFSPLILSSHRRCRLLLLPPSVHRQQFIMSCSGFLHQ